MIEKFLRAKHWQLFLFGYGIPMVFQIIASNILTKDLEQTLESQGSDIDFSIFLPYIMPYIIIISIVSIISMVAIYGWYWSIGVGLQEKIPSHLQRSTGLFKFFILLPVVYTPILFYYLFIFIQEAIAIEALPESYEMLVGLGLGYLVVIFGAFYTLYFVAKTLKTVELQEEARFGEYIGYFFLAWFYFIGVWIMQPKINQIMEDEFTEGFEDHLVDERYS